MLFYADKGLLLENGIDGFGQRSVVPDIGYKEVGGGEIIMKALSERETMEDRKILHVGDEGL